MYFTVETYYNDIIPIECTTGYHSSVFNSMELNHPLLDFRVFYGNW